MNRMEYLKNIIDNKLKFFEVKNKFDEGRVDRFILDEVGKWDTKPIKFKNYEKSTLELRFIKPKNKPNDKL